MTEPPSGTLIRRLFSPFAQIRPGEALTALLMFAYSFLAMTSYNIVKPITRSEFIGSLGADNLPWVQFGSGLVIGVIMQLYSRVMARVPRRWTVPVTQAAMIGLLVAFWLLFTRVGAEWVSVLFYLYGLILGLLLISQFWIIANDIYDARQAKRLFGFIGGGASLGGATGAGLTAALVTEFGSHTMLLVSAAIMTACLLIVVFVIRREQAAGSTNAAAAGDEEGVGGAEAIRLLLSSRHLQLIAGVIAFAAVGAAIVEQQLNMAAAESADSTDAVAALLAQIIVYLSLIGFFIQVVLTSRIHRFLGIGFALMILPVSLGATGILMLTVGAFWTAGVARVLDTSLRYTVDKTSREILFLPLPLDLKYRAKPFIDVTMDRLSKGLGALLLLVLIKDWGLGLTWQQLSFASLTMTVAWIVFALRARREYLRAFRRSIEEQEVKPAEIRLDTADLTTIETLVGQLSRPEPRRVIYAVDLLESLDKRQLVSPLLLHHESPEVRVRALRLAEALGPKAAQAWLAGIERSLADEDGEVRLAAVRALAAVRHEEAVELMRPYLTSDDPRLAITAAASLASSTKEADVRAAEDTLQRLASDTRSQAAPVRREVAHALGRLHQPRFRPLLVPLIYDRDVTVAREAILSAERLGGGDFLFVPPLVALLRNHLLKGAARKVLVSYGEPVVDALAYFLQDREEHPWVRRHVPSTLALLPYQRSMDVLIAALDDGDGFVRFKAGAAIERLHRTHPELRIDTSVAERQISLETTRAFDALTLHHNLFVTGGLDPSSMLARALAEKHQRAVDRVFRLLSLIHPPDDIGAVRRSLRVGDARTRSSATEFLDNLLTGDIRKRVMLLLEDMPEDERVRKGNVIFKTRARDVEDTLAQLVHDEDQAIAATAVYLAGARGFDRLLGDLEHARDAGHGYAAEAAAWVLSRRTAERDGAAPLEPLPAVELAERLRQLRLFDFCSVNELFRIADLGRQVRHEAGRVIYEAGVPPDSLQFLLEGDVAIAEGDDRVTEAQAPAVIGFEEHLEGSAMRSTVKALTPAVCLSLTTEQFLSLLAENSELAQGIFRMLIETRLAPDWRTVVHGRLWKKLQDKVDDGLQPVDRVLLLQASPLLARATAAELLELAAIAKHVPLRPGTDPLSEATPSILVVLRGEVRVTRGNGDADTAHPGDAIGIYETLGGAPLAGHAEVIEPGTALKFDRAELFDLLADRVELLQALFSGILHAPAPEGEHVH
ncbi:MAG: Npt1/Npt2 family nucleotide transporter [Acidobacteriota bacterium]